MGLDAHHQLYHEARAWLEFNHRIGGIIVLVLAGLTWLELREVRPSLLIRLSWPSCLMLLGGYNLLWSDKPAWPIGPSGLVDSLSNSEILQHKILALLVLTLGLIDLLRRLQRATHPAWLYLFYGLAALTGGVLVVHDPTLPSPTHLPGLASSHTLMGVLAILVLVFKVLVDHRLMAGRIAYLYPLLLAALGVQLVLFSAPGETGVEIKQSLRTDPPRAAAPVSDSTHRGHESFCRLCCLGHGSSNCGAGLLPRTQGSESSRIVQFRTPASCEVGAQPGPGRSLRMSGRLAGPVFLPLCSLGQG